AGGAGVVEAVGRRGGGSALDRRRKGRPGPSGTSIPVRGGERALFFRAVRGPVGRILIGVLLQPEDRTMRSGTRLALAGALFVAMTAVALAAEEKEPSPSAPPPGLLRRFGSDRFRITGAPLASALSPDGTRLAVLSAAQGRGQVILNVLDTETGRSV